jgi:formylglycine-generating enzyme required for sulfatase activity
MGATPLSVSIWKEYCDATGTLLPTVPKWGLLDDHPVVNVSWNDVMGADGNGGFCAWASHIAGFRLTLPTEAQFEYASRGGQEGLTYPWGNSFDESKLWCSLFHNQRTGTAPVNRYTHIFTNAYGLSDMSGNVWEWCSDFFYDARELSSFVGPATSYFMNHRVVRGGSWYFLSHDYFKCNHRVGIASQGLNIDIGFRLSAGPG